MAKKFNHKLKNTFDAVGLQEQQTTELIKKVLLSFNDIKNPSTSNMVEHLENNLTKRQLALLTSQTFLRVRQLENKLNTLKQPVQSDIGVYGQTQG